MAGKVLIIDDQPDSMDLLLRALEPDGYEFCCVPDGLDAVRLAEDFLPDVVLLDVMMPGSSGYDVCKEMRRSPLLKDSTIMLITALQNPTSRKKGFQSGADDFLSKPVELDLLRIRVRAIARLGRYRRSLQQRSWYEDLTRFSPLGIMAVDPRGLVLSANPVAEALLSAVAGTHIASLVGSSGETLFQKAWRDVREGPQECVRFEARLGHPEGNFFQAEITLSRSSALSSPIDLIVTIEDVSERSAIRERLEDAQRLEAVARMTRGLAHDFNNYLAAIRAGAELTCYVSGQPNEIEAMMAQVIDQVDQASELVSRLQEFGNGTTTQQMARIELNAFIRHAEPLLQLLANDALAVTLGSEPVWLMADITCLRQVLVNLVVNARDAISAKGHVHITVWSEMAATGAARAPGGARNGSCGLRVSDDGCGMDEQTRKRMFEPYFTTKSGKGGTGLGLSTVHSLVIASGGVVHVDSTPGHGTTFTISWPMLVSEPLSLLAYGDHERPRPDH